MEESLADDTRSRVLAAIRTATTPPSVDELAAALALHPNSIRLHTVALAEAGLIEQSKRPTGGRGRPLNTWRITRNGAWSGTRDYELLAAMLLDGLRETSPDPAAAARRAGRTWGQRLGQARDRGAGRVVEVLDDLGFEPQSGEATIELRNCPFRELVEPGDRLVCALHAGMLDGLTEDTGTSVELVPFSTPVSCAVHVNQD